MGVYLRNYVRLRWHCESGRADAAAENCRVTSRKVALPGRGEGHDCVRENASVLVELADLPGSGELVQLFRLHEHLARLIRQGDCPLPWWTV